MIPLRYRYRVYGITVASDRPLTLPAHADGGLARVECRSATASVFHAAMSGAAFDPSPDPWHRYASLPDGSTYVQWDTVGEFLVDADGRRIACRRAARSSAESFQVYMLGQALSFALVKQRLEPLHATAIVVEDRAIAFLGAPGFGKSTLAAGFLEAGHRLLTDDLLVVREHRGRALAYPGPPRIKLFPRTAGRLVSGRADRVTMNAATNKLILPIDADRRCAAPVPLAAIYSLSSPRDACRQNGVSIDRLSGRDAFVELLKGTFNRRFVKPERLARQFEAMTSLTNLVAVSRLAYPRTLEQLQHVREKVLADLESRDA
jgi:hypothetical protein